MNFVPMGLITGFHGRFSPENRPNLLPKKERNLFTFQVHGFSAPHWLLGSGSINHNLFFSLAIGVLTSNRRGGWLPTLAGFTLGAIAGVPLLGAFVGCHCWVPLWGAMAGCHGWMLATNFGGVHLGCHCWVRWGAVARCHCWVRWGAVAR